MTYKYEQRRREECESISESKLFRLFSMMQVRVHYTEFLLDFMVHRCPSLSVTDHQIYTCK